MQNLLHDDFMIPVMWLTGFWNWPPLTFVNKYKINIAIIAIATSYSSQSQQVEPQI